MKTLVTAITHLLAALAASPLRAFADARTTADLEQRLLDLTTEAQGLQNRADAEGRVLTAEEGTRIEACLDECDSLRADLDRRRRLEAQASGLSASRGRVVPPAEPQASGASRVSVGADRSSLDPRAGFVSFGEFARSVRQAARPGNLQNADPRLFRNAPTTVSTESVGPDGGFAVPPDFRTAIWTKIMAESSLLSMTDQYQTSSNQISIPKDETTPWQTTGGVQCYWEGENKQLTQSKLALEATTVRANKLTALVPVTEELAEDAPALDNFLRSKVGAKMDFAINKAIISGNGVGQPLGILSAACLKTITKEGSQVATTLVAENVMKIWSGCYAEARRNAVWLCNQDIEPQLDQMKLLVKNVAGTENVGGWPLYVPPGGLSSSPYGTLKGRPVIFTQACSTLGTVGDIILADLSSYMTVVKTGGLRSDVSMHLWFDYDTLAYRFIIRLGGQPWWNAAMSALNGSSTYSPFVTVETRS